MQRRPTIDDVAKLCGVGRATVSRVLNDGPNVSARMRARVTEAVEQLGFTINLQAQSLATRSSRTITFICATDIDREPNSFYRSAFEMGALEACERVGLRLNTQIFAPHPERGAVAVFDRIRDSRSSAVILSPPFSDDRELIRLLLESGCPTVCVSPADIDTRLVPSIGIDDEAAGHEVARHVLMLGHRRIGYIQGIESHLSAERRFLGMVRALGEFGIDAATITTERGDFTFQSGKDALIRILTAHPVPSVVLCANDDMAVGALFAARQWGLSVPEDLSIVGFDDAPVSAMVWPPLTTVHQPVRTIGARAVELASVLIAESPSGQAAHLAPDRPLAELVPYRYLPRQSLAPFSTVAARGLNAAKT